MNPWGIVVLAVGAVIMWVGVRGTQGTIYADVFGHPYVPAGNTPLSGPLSAAIAYANGAVVGGAAGTAVAPGNLPRVIPGPAPSSVTPPVSV